MVEFTIGCDPEVFVKRDGMFHSAWGIIPGTKLEPFRVEKGAVQVDGNALEFNIDPASTREEFVGNIRTVYNKMKEMTPEYEFVISPTARFSPKHWAMLPMEAKMMGCEPDYNAWANEVNEPPAGEDAFRAAGGHVHIGFLQPGDYADPMDPVHFEDCRVVAKQMDYFLGMWSLTWDKDNLRRQMYGKAGCFRPKPYGVEYRTLSNAWLKTEELQGWVFDAAVAGMEALKRGTVIEKVAGDFASTAINRGYLGWNDRMSNYTGLEMPPGGYWGAEKTA